MIIENKTYSAPQRQTVAKGSMVGKDTFTGVLSETASFFKDQYQINMVSDFGSHIITDDALFEHYVDNLTKNVSSDDAVLLEQLCVNTRNEILSENQLATIPAFSGYCLPIIVKLFARCAMISVIPTETPTKPTFSINYKVPYILDNAGTKHILPEALRDNPENTLNELPPLHAGYINVPNSSAVNLLTSTTVNGVACSKVKRDYIDRVLYLDKAKVELDDGASGTELVEVTDLRLQADIKGNIYGTITAKNTIEEITDTVFARVDLETGDTVVASTLGKVKQVAFKGSVSQAFNWSGETVSFEVVTKDIQIGEGAHLNAALPIEFIKDTKAVFNIDAAAECVDIMSQVGAQKVDQEIRRFLAKSFADHDGVAKYTGSFQCKPSGGYVGLPAGWRAELKRVVDFWANKLKTQTQLSIGYFAIVGNPNDVALLEDVEWQIKGSTAEHNGCRIEYEYGVMSGSNQFRVLSSSNIPEGELIMFFCPTEERYITYKYYPYSFDLVNTGYQNPNTPYVPNIMLTRRQAYFDLIPMQVRIKIEGNQGSSYGNYAL